MIKKTLLTAAAALAITSGASVLQAPQAEAGYHGYYGHGYYGHRYYKRHCFTKWRKIKVRRRGHHGHYYKWIWRPYKRCY